MSTYLITKSALSRHVTTMCVYDIGFGMSYEAAEKEADRINAAIDKAENVDALIAAAVQAEREAQKPLIDALVEIQRVDSDGFIVHTAREIVGIARAAIRARSEVKP